VPRCAWRRTNFTLRNSFLHDNENENGILSGANTASNIVIEYSEFGHNGFGTGYTHNLYIGNVASLTFRHHFSHDAHVGHNLKSRARQHDCLQPLLEPARRRTGTPACSRTARKAHRIRAVTCT